MSKNKWFKVTGTIGPNGDVQLLLDGKKYSPKRNKGHACDFFDVKMGKKIVGRYHLSNIAYGRDNDGMYLKIVPRENITAHFRDGVYLRPNWKFYKKIILDNVLNLVVNIMGAEEILRDVKENIKSLKKELRKANKRLDNIPE